MPMEEFAKEVIRKANEFKNPATGDRLGDIMREIVLACARATETEEEMLDCIEDAYRKLTEIVQEVKRARK